MRKASQSAGKFPIVLCQRLACPCQGLLPEFERFVEPFSPAGPLYTLSLLHSKEFVMHAFRKLVLATLAGMALAVPFGFSALSFAEANGTAAALAVRYERRGPFLTQSQADAAGKNAVRNGHALRYDPPFELKNQPRSELNGWYVRLTMR